jgi:signal transduction histidine kinase
MPGSGLGLYVVMRIVKKYHGEISARINEDGDFEIHMII